VSADRRRFLVGDSVWCGGLALVCLILMDAVALVMGGRHEVPALGLWLPIAGLLLAVLNVYFVLRDLLAVRRGDAALGLGLSVLALFVAINPPWARFVRCAGIPPGEDVRAESGPALPGVSGA